MKRSIFLTKWAITLLLVLTFRSQAFSQCAGFCGGLGSSFACYCDDACWLWGDCCPDICTFCPTEGPNTILACSGSSGGGCNTNTSICTPGTAGPFNFVTPGIPVSSCLDFIGPDVGYIVLNITSSGPLNMLIDGNASTGFLDVAVFNVPSGQDPCTAILSLSNEIGCNYADFSSGCNQFGTAFPCISSVPAPMVTAGQTLMIVVENWSGASSSFTLSLGPSPGAQTGPPDATITGLPTFCTTDAPVQLMAADMGGTWTGTGVSSSGMFDPAAAGVGTHTITYTIGSPPCDATDTETFTVINCMVACMVNSITATPSACNPATNTYSVSGNVTFTNPPATGTLTVSSSCGGSQTFSAPFVSPIAYNLTGITADGAPCTITAVFSADATCTGTTNYTAPADCTPPPCNISSITAVPGGCNPLTNTYNVNGSISFTNAPTTGTLTVTSSCGSTLIFNAPFTSPQAYSFTGLPATGGSCTVTAAFSDETACTNSVSYAVPTPPAITTPPTNYCVGDAAVNITAAPAGGMFTGSGISGAGSFDPSAAGTGAHTIIYVSGGTCPLSDSVVLTVNSIPTISGSATPATICEGASSTLNASGAATYTWTPATGLSATTGATVTASPAVTTVYTLTGTSATGCNNSIVVPVTVNTAPTITVNSGSICLGENIELTASGGVSYTWTPATGLSSTTGATVTASPTSTVTYTVTGTSVNGCTSTANAVVNVIDPTASFTASPVSGPEPLLVNFNNNSSGNSYYWDFGNGLDATTSSISPNASTTYDSAGIYTVMLISVEGTCVDTAYLNIEVLPVSSLLVPNIITANGDGKNDEFKVIGVALKSLDVKIFNRWGQLVGTLVTPDDTWDGSNHSEGTYFYLLKAEGLEGAVYEQQGNFTLVK